MIHEQLSYPIEAPQPGQLAQVAPGVHWIRLPLPFALDHINVWALRDGDGDGWALVDTGTRTDGVVAAWEGLLDKPPLHGPLTRVLVTHMHPDHIGMAGWLTRKYGAPLWISRLEYLSCRTLVADTSREAPADAVRFLLEAGWNREAIDMYRARFGGFGKMIYTLPDSFRRLEDGLVLQIGAQRWEVVTGSGHSPEHACLYCAELKLLISGDQVLPRISSNVSVHPTEPEANPMADWLASLDKLQARVPDDVLVLPAHNDPFFGLHARLDHLVGGHERGLTRLKDLIAKPKRVVDVFGVLFRRKIDEYLLGLATGESLAHLNCLIARGEAVRERDTNGVDWYRAAA
jgi:glyoxylase-like metal-dependent hydrolase (beta-lactamase superfamily II)